MSRPRLRIAGSGLPAAALSIDKGYAGETAGTARSLLEMETPGRGWRAGRFFRARAYQAAAASSTWAAGWAGFVSEARAIGVAGAAAAWRETGNTKRAMATTIPAVT